MKCNACHRDASFEAKFSFAQDKDAKPPRMVISFETEGGYCTHCKERMERMAKENNFTEIIGADVRQEASIIFDLRGLGKIAWNDTVIEFKKLKTPDKNLSLPLDKMV